MDYSKLADVYEELESTSKKLEKTEILAKLFKSLSSKSLYRVALLSRGKVFPESSEEDIGIAASTMKQVIAKATGESKKKIISVYKDTGDLGLTVEKLVSKKKQRTLADRNLTVKKVYKNLRKLPKMSGSGSQSRKVDLVAELVSCAKPKEARYVVRTVLGELRVGVAEGLVRDAIGKAFGIEPSDVEEAFNLLTDYGKVAQLAKKGGKELKDVSLKIGTPIRVQLAEKSEGLEEAMETFDKPALEFKYDGFRCITGLTPIYVKEKGLLSVKDVKEGDMVLTHKGRFEKVVAKNKRKIDKGEKLFELQTYLGNSFRITEGHKILCKRNGLEWIPVEKIRKDDLLAFPAPKFKTKSVPRELTLQTKSGYSKKIIMDEKFFRFLGYWIGDGFTNKYHNTERIGLMFNKKDKKLKESYKDLVKKTFKIKEISEYSHDGGISVYWRDKPFRIWLTKNFRRDWTGKMIPKWFTGIDKKRFEEFLQGWIESDGSESPQGTIRITTKERDLAALGQLICLSKGKVVGVRKFRAENKKTYYFLIVPKTRKKAWLEEGHLFTKINRLKELKKRDPRTPLYNLQVSDDKSYCTPLTALHNCQIHKKRKSVKLFSRRLDEVTKQFPEIVEWVKKNVKGKNFIIEGEVLAIGKDGKPRPFQKLSKRIKRKYKIEKMMEEIPIQMNLFELLAWKGDNYMKKPLKKRWKKLKSMVKETKDFKLAEHMETKSKKKAENFYEKSLKKGQEGLIVKNLDAEYKPGKRVGYWLKVKPTMEPLDLVIVKAKWGKGKRSKWLSSLTLACKDDKGEFLPTGKMGTGLTEDQLKKMTKKLKKLVVSEEGRTVKLKPKIVVEVGYEEIQKSPKYASGYALRFPRLLRFREEEKKPEDVNKVGYIEKLYKQQRGK